MQNEECPETGGRRSEAGTRRPRTLRRASLHPEADRAKFPAQMSTLAEIEEAAAKLNSPDFVRLLEDLHDLATARVALGELKQDPTSKIAWNELRAELDALHG